MFIIDTLLLSPVHATIWAARQINNAIQQEREERPEQITAELRQLYMKLETGQITEAEFDAREKDLLDALDAVENSNPGQADEEPADDDTDTNE